MISPYIVFSGECEEAINFYEKVFNAKNKSIIRYDNYVPENIADIPSNLENYILHAELEINGIKLTFADEVVLPVIKGTMVYITIHYTSTKEAEKVYKKLIQDGEFLLPPTETFYSPMHTSIRDKFGIQWNIIVINKETN